MDYLYRNTPIDNKSKTITIFLKGQYRSTLKEVKRNIKLYGVPEVCTYKKGLFEKTMPLFSEPIAAIFLDIDLASSTKTCLTYLYPLLQSCGVLYSHDGHLDRVLEVYRDKIFWKRKVGTVRPLIQGIGKQKLLKIIKK